jgi:riboflavin biosynthesis pyrimidine reductase
MVTSIGGRAQRGGSAEGIASRADRRLMQLYRFAHDAIGSGTGTMRAAGLWLRLTRDLAARRVADGRPPHPTGVLIAGTASVATDAHWFAGDEPRILFVGSDNPMRVIPAGTELIRASTPHPEPQFVLDRLGERGIRSLLLEGGPHLNTSFVGAGLVDELCWTIGPLVLATDALAMTAPMVDPPPEPVHGHISSVLRHDDELFVRYRLGDSRT